MRAKLDKQENSASPTPRRMRYCDLPDLGNDYQQRRQLDTKYAYVCVRPVKDITEIYISIAL